jgi:RNA polymerase sigma-70 factor, ECF subfamily
MKLDPGIRDQDSPPCRVRASAISLCGNIDRADDLVQETLLRALTHIEQLGAVNQIREDVTSRFLSGK